MAADGEQSGSDGDCEWGNGEWGIGRRRSRSR